MCFRKTESESKAWAECSILAAIPELPVCLVCKYWADQSFGQNEYHRVRFVTQCHLIAEPPSCAGVIGGSWAFMAEVFIGISIKNYSKEVMLVWLGLFWILTYFIGRLMPWPVSQTCMLESFPQLPASLFLSPETPIFFSVNRYSSVCILGVKNK